MVRSLFLPKTVAQANELLTRFCGMVTRKTCGGVLVTNGSSIAYCWVESRGTDCVSAQSMSALEWAGSSSAVLIELHLLNASASTGAHGVFSCGSKQNAFALWKVRMTRFQEIVYKVCAAKRAS